MGRRTSDTTARARNRVRSAAPPSTVITLLAHPPARTASQICPASLSASFANERINAHSNAILEPRLPSRSIFWLGIRVDHGASPHLQRLPIFSAPANRVNYAHSAT